MALVIREGDPTSTGGIVVAGSSTHTVEFRKAARISDPVWCPACKSMGFIAEGNPTVIDEHLAVATEGHAVKCGCPFGSNRLIATQGSVVAGTGGSIGIAPDLAVRAEAATEIWARAIREGTYTNQFTTDIPTHAVRGLASSQCVFAKSCSVPRGSTTAGTTVEPADSFGRIALLGTVEQKSSVVASDRGAAAAGTVALGRVAGQSIFEGLGGWGLRGTAMTAGTAASTLLLALWPSNMGDGTLYGEDELRGLSAASTRVRFQFRRGTDGIVRAYGLHTQTGSVPVVDARWSDGKRAMEAQLGGVTIIWTPNEGPVVSAPTTYPGVTEALDNVLVHPIAEDADSEIEVFPAEDDLTWQDVIITFPADSGVPPLYLVFAKPAVKPLEVDTFGAFSGRPRNGLHVDHMPSQAAIRRYLQNNFRTLTAKQVEEYLKKVAGVAIPARVHQKFSETYGGRNTETKQLQDADDLRTALDNNFNAIKPYMLEEGFAGADLEVARARMHEINEEQGWY